MHGQRIRGRVALMARHDRQQRERGDRGQERSVAAVQRDAARILGRVCRRSVSVLVLADGSWMAA